MADITILARLIDGLTRNVDLSNNALVVGSLKVGSSDPIELTRAILSNLISLQDGSDVSAGLHHHDSRYWTKDLLASSMIGSSGASSIGVSGTPVYFTVEGTSVQEYIEGIDRELKNVNRTVFKDNEFGIVNHADASRKMVFNTDSLTPDTLRTVYMANANIDLADVNIAVLTTGARAFTADQSMGGYRITELAPGVNSEDAVNKSQLDLKVNLSSVGVAGGVASLDSGGKVPVSQLPNSIMEYQGIWNPDTNTPFLADGFGNTGDVYRVNAAGSHDFGSGVIEFVVGDYAVYNGSVWEKSHSGSDAVRLVNGYAGVVVLTTSDIEEGSNLYFSEDRARTAVVLDTLAGSETNYAPSVNAVNLAILTRQPASPNLDEADAFFASTDITAAQANQLIMGENADSLHTHGQLKYVAVAGESLAANSLQAVRWAVSGETLGAVYLAGNDTTLGNLFWVWGIVVPSSAAAAGDSVKVTFKGSVAIGSADTPFDAGQIGKAVYLSSDGSYSLTPPSSPGVAIVRLGYVQTTTSIWLDIGLHGIA
ncbi:Coiled stalk of trimeric autotransporter adhesin [uncultured Caudovirales phage]|uniref:Coiled stalk of trimeric autotransporter adhesin n=1 Tax=uncultured Caudovirales phage TaxID=2100421 RepID=A0A6J7WZF1_9CAUD|nr:Coiled stalk of trimeric autotransporter adhesin [uncultured Caudovirales phage]